MCERTWYVLAALLPNGSNQQQEMTQNQKGGQPTYSVLFWDCGAARTNERQTWSKIMISQLTRGPVYAAHFTRSRAMVNPIDNVQANRKGSGQA